LLRSGRVSYGGWGSFPGRQGKGFAWRGPDRKTKADSLLRRDGCLRSRPAGIFLYGCLSRNVLKQFYSGVDERASESPLIRGARCRPHVSRRAHQRSKEFKGWFPCKEPPADPVRARDALACWRGKRPFRGARSEVNTRRGTASGCSRLDGNRRWILVGYSIKRGRVYNQVGNGFCLPPNPLTRRAIDPEKKIGRPCPTAPAPWRKRLRIPVETSGFAAKGFGPQGVCAVHTRGNQTVASCRRQTQAATAHANKGLASYVNWKKVEAEL